MLKSKEQTRCVNSFLFQKKNNPFLFGLFRIQGSFSYTQPVFCRYRFSFNQNRISALSNSSMASRLKDHSNNNLNRTFSSSSKEVTKLRKKRSTLRRKTFFFKETNLLKSKNTQPFMILKRRFVSDLQLKKNIKRGRFIFVQERGRMFLRQLFFKNLPDQKTATPRRDFSYGFHMSSRWNIKNANHISPPKLSEPKRKTKEEFILSARPPLFLGVEKGGEEEVGFLNNTKKPRFLKERNAYLIPDFVEIQRKSFFQLLENGLIEEFSKRNPITNKNLEIFFYPEYYQLAPPEFNPRRAILNSKSYSSKLFIPVQLTDKNLKKSQLKWVLIGNLPLMTKRGHFVLNGAPRVIVNQILRSPGIYFQGSLKEIFSDQWSEKPERTYKRFYTDLICLRGTWLRIEIDKNKDIWAQMKKVPKIPLLWFLLAMGLTERIIFKSVFNPTRLLANFNLEIERKTEYEYVTNAADAWKEIANLISSTKETGSSQYVDFTPTSTISEPASKLASSLGDSDLNSPVNLEPRIKSEAALLSLIKKTGVRSALSSKKKDRDLITKKSLVLDGKKDLLKLEKLQEEEKDEKSKDVLTKLSRPGTKRKLASFLNIVEHSKEGRNWIFKRFMNPRAYDLGSQGRLNFNRKLGLSISSHQTTLTAQDVLFATDYLFKVEKGLKNIDDIDHLKNRRVRTSGELLQIQIGIGLVRLEKIIREKFSKINAQTRASDFLTNKPNNFKSKALLLDNGSKSSPPLFLGGEGGDTGQTKVVKNKNVYGGSGSSSTKLSLGEEFKLNNLINTKAFNGALREFFGSSPLSQFMDQLNPLAEITHKRRLSSMGPGGVTRDSATLAIRGIHPTHYGRICPIETPEGKNTGLVNSLTTYSRASSQGFLESPFYKVYKGQVQKNAGMFFLSAEQEENIKVSAADVALPGRIGFLPKNKIPAKIAYGDTISKISRNIVEYIGVSPIQMISIATSLIPFVEHDDANRALMGSNMQRQAVPLIRAERPLVGTGLESRTVSDSGHAVIAKESGYVAYVSGKKIVIYTIPDHN